MRGPQEGNDESFVSLVSFVAYETMRSISIFEIISIHSHISPPSYHGLLKYHRCGEQRLFGYFRVPASRLNPGQYSPAYLARDW